MVTEPRPQSPFANPLSMPRGKKIPRRSPPKDPIVHEPNKDESPSTLKRKLWKPEEATERVEEWVREQLPDKHARTIALSVAQAIYDEDAHPEPGVIRHLLDNSAEVFGNVNGYRLQETYNDARLNEMMGASAELAVILKRVNDAAREIAPAIEKLHERAGKSSNL